MKSRFLIGKSIYILKVYSIDYILTQNTNVKETSFTQYKRYKKPFFFLSGAPTHGSFTFNLLLFYELEHMVHLSKSVCGISHFRFGLVFIKL